MRFLAEATWHPTALLPGHGVTWEAVDEASAYATLIDGSTSVRLLFQFDDQGLVHTVYSDGRYREVDGEFIETPWQGRFWNYDQRDGILVPLNGEVSWMLQAWPNDPHGGALNNKLATHP